MTKSSGNPAIWLPVSTFPMFFEISISSCCSHVHVRSAVRPCRLLRQFRPWNGHSEKRCPESSRRPCAVIVWPARRSYTERVPNIGFQRRHHTRPWTATSHCSHGLFLGQGEPIKRYIVNNDFLDVPRKIYSFPQSRFLLPSWYDRSLSFLKFVFIH